MGGTIGYYLPSMSFCFFSDVMKVQEKRVHLVNTP